MSYQFLGEAIQEYDGVNAFGYYLLIFKIAAGDFSTDNYQDQSQYLVVLTWLVWVIAVISLNIVFMNFIIAVISESYEKVMQKIVAESYKVKAHMIREREQFFGKAQLSNEKLFPQYLVLRRQVNYQIIKLIVMSDIDQLETVESHRTYECWQLDVQTWSRSRQSEAGMTSIREWQGFTKDIKNTVRSTVARTKNELIQNFTIQNIALQKSNEKANEQYEETKKNYEEIKTNVEQAKQGIDELKTKLESLEQFVRESLDKLILKSNRQKRRKQE
ncbi:UNKNOWN [Stylonychia lemnae]|uniref:Ion transport domain-containing protein n=1 Tax=Stylonychia lemnae TaxID=5949 RepID=A0A077ZNB4_STYLE|nr:UNKNOWN [Stylonychia lemnae]|eukprot:CDW71472.1 UNKNOWN [Stylonychia lemnae]